MASQAIDDVICVEVQDFKQAALAVAEEAPFDLILLDLNMPGMTGFTGLLEIRDAAPETPVIVVSATEEPEVIERTLTCGAMGYITKSAPKEQMINAICKVMRGEEARPSDALPRPKPTAGRGADLMECLGSLTKRQRMVLNQLAQGKSNKQIAYEIDVTNTTVKAHVTAILRKLKVTSRTQAVIIARQIDGLLKGA